VGAVRCRDAVSRVAPGLAGAAAAVWVVGSLSLAGARTSSVTRTSKSVFSACHTCDSSRDEGAAAARLFVAHTFFLAGAKMFLLSASSQNQLP
jgi:hypothetical protein